MKGLFFAAGLLFLTIKAAQQATKQKKSQQLPPATQDRQPGRNISRWRGRLALVVAWCLGLSTLISFAISIWGPFWPLLPEIDPGPPDLSEPFQVPFTVKNPSHLLALKDIQFSCLLQHLNGGNNITFENNLFTIRNRVTIQPDERDTYKCWFPFDLSGPIASASIRIIVDLAQWPWSRRKSFDQWEFTWDLNARPPRWVPGHQIGLSQ
jgi:hypothetical protein